MDDLSGLDWSAKPSSGQKPNYRSSAFPTLQPTPPGGSERLSPLPRSVSPNLSIKSPSSATDSFSNLVSFNNSNANKNLSLLEQQQNLANLKVQQVASSSQKVQDQYAGADDHFWNNLGSGRSTPQVPNAPTNGADEDEDFLAAFNKPTTAPAQQSGSKDALPPVKSLVVEDDDDDDPFGLSEFRAKKLAAAQTRSEPQRDFSQEDVADDDDVLGLLGKPVSEQPKVRKKGVEKGKPDRNPQDNAIAELVEMGFPVEKARQALQITESGVDTQAAVGWLLNQAHSESRARSQNRGDALPMPRTQTGSRGRERSMPRDSRSTTSLSESGRTASDIGSNFMKSAGSFWKQAKKHAQLAMQDLNSDSDSSQPKWMKGVQIEQREPPQFSRNATKSRETERTVQSRSSNVTDEALMLETSRPENSSGTPRPQQRQRHDIAFESTPNTSRDHSPAVSSGLKNDRIVREDASKPRQQQAPPPAQARTTLNRQAAEQEAAKAYVSSARRRKPTAPLATFSEADLLGNDSSVIQTSEQPQSASVERPAASSQSVLRPPAPKRDIPVVSAIALKASHSDRETGNSHFKRGDYASAHQSYTQSLSQLPKSHPITIILLTNRALTAIKTGEPKQAVADSNTAIALIGISKGESETIDLSNGEAPKPMRDYFGKALIRKAEALEHMEKWADAASVWQEAVSNGHGGSAAIQGRMRAEKATNTRAQQSKPAPARKPASAAQRKAMSSVGAAAEAAAVSKLRAQNAAAEKIDDEKFALADSVDAKLNAWKGGKQDNLRALLGSLDSVLWPETGWKKISMADLVLPNKVKVQYMKGIAKVHPDKIPTNASTEHRMIAGAVFSTLNEAWDKFKKENNL